MELSSVEEHYSTLFFFIKTANQYVGSVGFAVVKARTKVSKKRIFRICYFQCDRSGKFKNNLRSNQRIHVFFRCIKCSFSAIAKLDEEGWFLTIRNLNHNYEPTLRGSHLTLRKLTMTDEVKQSIARQSRTQAAPATILTNLRLDGNSENPVFKRKDIYNVRAAIKKDALDFLSPIQALMKFLTDAD